MDPAEFERKAALVLEEIPAEYQAGVDAVVVREQALVYPSSPGVLTMGECVTERWPDGVGGGDARSQIILYYGSFRELASHDPTFDWKRELRETILHELLHHREAAANQAGLELFDWAVQQDYLRRRGDPFDPAFYRVVPADSDGVVRVESDTFIEVTVPRGAREAEFAWRGRRCAVHLPERGDPVYVNVRNVGGGRLWIVAWRSSTWWRRLLGRSASEVRHVTRRALPVPASSSA